MVRALLLPDYYLVTVMLSGIKVSLGGFLGGPYGFQGGGIQVPKGPGCTVGWVGFLPSPALLGAGAQRGVAGGDLGLVIP